MMFLRIVKGRNHVDLERNANELLKNIQESGGCVIDTDVAGRASDSGEEWIMTITYKK